MTPAPQKYKYQAIDSVGLKITYTSIKSITLIGNLKL